jgi:hypothetical protein
MIDKWEREIAQGLVPDLLEDLTDEQAKDLLDWSQRVYKQKVARGEILSPEEVAVNNHLETETFADTY